MVGQRMESQGGRSDAIGGTQTPAQTQTHNPKPNPLTRQGSLYSLTLDEVQNQLGDLGKPLSSMNLDELLKTVFTVEGNNSSMEGVEFGQSGLHSNPPALGPSLNRQSSLTLSRDLSKKTVDQVWQDIQQEERRGSLDRKGTLGEMTLEDFLVKAGVVAESDAGRKNTGGFDSVGGLAQQAQWMNYPMPQQGIMPVYVPGSLPVQPSIPVGGNALDVGFKESQMSMSSSPILGALSDPQTPRRKRVGPDDIVEKSVERRQKRMIKNRESAARSRARKQAYTHELENKVSHLEEENERLKKQQEWEKSLPATPAPPPKYQLRRTSSAPT